MWVVHLMLTLAALYSSSSRGCISPRPWLLFPTMFAGAARIQLPASTSASRGVDARRRKSCLGANSVLRSDRRAPTLLGFGGNAWNAEATALTLHALFPQRNVARPLPRLCAEQRLAERADAVLGLRHNLPTASCKPRLASASFRSASASARRSPHISPRHRPVTGMILVTPLDSLEAVARDLYWWAPRRAAPPQSHAHDFRPRLPRAHRPDHSGARRPCAGTTQRASGTWSFSAPPTRGTTIFTTCLTSRPRPGALARMRSFGQKLMR